jgi:hypothetical protein
MNGEWEKIRKEQPLYVSNTALQEEPAEVRIDTS